MPSAHMFITTTEDNVDLITIVSTQDNKGVDVDSLGQTPPPVNRASVLILEWEGSAMCPLGDF